jgi:hypothetical protein
VLKAKRGGPATKSRAFSRFLMEKSSEEIAFSPLESTRKGVGLR